jgi:hypothetical protein
VPALQPRCLVPSRSLPLRWSSRLGQARHGCGVHYPPDDAHAAADRFDTHVGMPSSKMALRGCSAIRSYSCSFPCPCRVCGAVCVCVCGRVARSHSPVRCLCLEPRTQVIAPYVADAAWAEAVTARAPRAEICGDERYSPTFIQKHDATPRPADPHGPTCAARGSALSRARIGSAGLHYPPFSMNTLDLGD